MKKELIEKLKKYNQEHLIARYNQLSNQKQEEFLKEIELIEFDILQDFFSSLNKPKETTNQVIEPIKPIIKDELTSDEKNHYIAIGEEALKRGQYAVVILAGGQGTRLGHDGPKGSFMVEIDPPKSIFEILCDNFKRTRDKYGVLVPWYIMTSDENNDATVEFFEKNNYFDYDKDSIIFFKQSAIEMIDQNGKVLISEDGHIKRGATGHGATFKALKDNNLIPELKEKGIEWLYIGNLDNILGKLIDPLLLGLVIEKKLLIGTRTLAKLAPFEKSGNLCRINGKPSVIEYSDMTEEMELQTNEKGELSFSEMNINCILFNMKVVEQCSNEPLNFHAAFKKANYIDESGNVIKATEPNAYKLETFIFDYFDRVDDILALRVPREDEFAAIKNREGDGPNNPTNAIKLYNDYWKRNEE